MPENDKNEVNLTKERLLTILEGIKNVRIGVVGDGCLDIYLDADMRLSELSRESPNFPLPIVRERIYLGGGTNVAVNAKSLDVSRVYMLTLIGKDWRGDSLKSKLNEEKIGTQHILADRDRITPAYCKPMRKGYSDIVYEDPRIDFENRVPMTEEQETGILREIGKLADKVDVIAVCDQFRYGMISERVRKELERLACRGKKIVVDSRSRIGLFRNVVIKPNEMEASAAVGNGNASRGKSRSTVEENIELLYRQNQAPVIVTMEEDGALWYDGKEFSFAAGIPVEPPVDIVGAGDAFLAAFSCAYGAGIPGPEAIAFGNLVSSIVIKKIGMTGTAAPDEILDQMIRYGKERTL